jgi:GDP-L-fucose synthase
MRKAVEAKEAGARSLTVWGTGTPRRDFIYVDDLADACLILLENVDEAGPINAGTGVNVTIRELAKLICGVIGYEGELAFAASKPDGTARKLMDVTRLGGSGGGQGRMWRRR